MIKKHRNKEHLNSLILGAIENDRIDELKFYTKLLDDNKNSEFLKSALIKCKLESSKFLSEMGFTISSPLFVLLNSPIENMHSVYKLLIDLGYTFNKTNNVGVHYSDYTSDSIKKYCIKRILNPYKVLDNPNRIDIAMKYLENGFFTEKDFEETLIEISIKHKDSRFKTIVTQYIREYKLNKLL